MGNEGSGLGRLQEVFARASELMEPERGAYLDRACEGDADLRREVERLLSSAIAGRGLFGGSESEWVLSPQKTKPLFVEGQLLAGRFRIREFLGRGGMGEVYAAEDSLGDNFALKVPLPEFAQIPEYRSRFINEIQLARKVTHPNVCRIFEFDWHRNPGAYDIPFFTMDLLEGENLSSYLKRNGPLPVGEALPLARQIAEGLEALHNREILHRDLKPGNVMLTRDERGRSRPVLMDFGLARGAPGQGACAEMVTSKLIGTPDYMAPEQRAGGKAGKYSDVYSFGLVLEKLIRFSDPPAELEAELKDLIRACTAHDPADRPADGSTLRKRLEGIGDDSRPTQVLEVAPRRSLPAEQPTSTPTFSELSSASGAAPFEPRAWIGAGATLCLLGAAVLWQIPAIRTPLADRVCAWAPGSTMFCYLPARRDLTVLPLEISGETPDDEMLGAGMNRHLQESLNRLYPGRGENCLHFRSDEESAYAATLLLRGELSVRDGSIHYTGRLRRTSDGLVVRTVSRSARLDDALGFAQELPPDLVAAAGGAASEEELELWRKVFDTDSEGFAAYLRGLAYLERAEKADKGEEWKQAVDALSDARGSGALGFALAAVRLGDAYREGFRLTGDDALASSSDLAYRQAHSGDRLPELHAGRGKLDILRGDRSAGVQRLETALDLNPFDSDLRFHLAYTLLGMGRKREGERVMLEGERGEPHCWLIPNMFARYYYEIGNSEKAEQELLKVVELSSNNMPAYGNLASLYLAAGQYREAIEKGLYAIHLAKHPQAYSTVGRAYIFAGCAKEGVEFLRLAVESEGTNRYVYWSNLGEFLRFLPGREAEAEEATREAVKEAREAVVARPSDGLALGVLARGLAWLGDSKGADDALAMLRRDAAESLGYYRSLASVRALTGDAAGATEAIVAALEKGWPPNEMRQDPALHALAGNTALRLALEQRDLDAGTLLAPPPAVCQWPH